MSKICVSLPATSLQKLEFLIKNSLEISDFFEIRFDYLNKSEILTSMNTVESIKSRSIFTLRSKKDRGYFSGSEMERIELLKFLFDSNPLYIDIELSTIRADPSLFDYIKSDKKKLLLSWHDFENTPKDNELEEKIEEMISFTNTIKLVTMAKNSLDALRLLNLYHKFPNVNLISFAMGDAGILSRILCTLVGNAPFSYASLETTTAPGQLSAKQMREIYDRIERHFSGNVHKC
ncbi:MAG: type I 3-dehydroquinate dehydratase [Nitrososphaeraceae archaeon]